MVDVECSTIADAGVLGREERVGNKQGPLDLDNVPVPPARVVLHRHGELTVAGLESALVEGETSSGERLRVPGVGN